ncbi:MAG: hypothetical protein OQL28_03250, partial [Sedimenticola sp.]|nr:hypothetical protein [Sedimenticola sp.]
GVYKTASYFHLIPHPNPGPHVPDAANRLHPCSLLPEGEGVCRTAVIKTIEELNPRWRDLYLELI